MQHAITPRSRTKLTRGTSHLKIKHASFANMIQSSRWADERRRRDEIHVRDFGGLGARPCIERWFSGLILVPHRAIEWVISNRF